MVAPIMRVENFNPNEVYMLAWLKPSDIDSVRLRLPDPMPLGCKVRLTECSQLAHRPELQREHRALFEACFTKQGDPLYWLDTSYSLKALVEVRRDNMLVAAAQACTVGPTASVENVMTHPDWRGHGLAKVALRRLMQWLCEHAKVVSLWCEPEQAQICIYQGVGFQMIEPSASSPGIFVTQ